MKWHGSNLVDGDVVISSRIRLARNLRKYPFSAKISNAQASELIADISGAIKSDRTPIGSQFELYNTNQLSGIKRLAMLERHIISPELLAKKHVSGALIKDDETVSIMINEEDHIRIQTFCAGDKIESAWDVASKLDDLLEESLEYAVDPDFGYLTSCPTNVGTGLRASFMVHIPALEATSQLRNIIAAISKFGMTVRGIYGEGTKPIGSIYQVSNQITLGQAEDEIIAKLKNVVSQVIDQECRIREKLIKDNGLEIEDRIYRAYGILKNARKITSDEAMHCLSELRLGIVTGIFKEQKPEKTIYELMMSVQPGNMQDMIGGGSDIEILNKVRADYIRSVI